MDLAIYSQVVKCSTVGELQSLMREHNITVHFTRNDGISLLHTFALLGSYDICKYLYSNGARPTLIQDNSTVFHSAVKAKNPSEDAERADILKLFLDKDIEEVDVNHRNEAGWTALKLAARRSLEKCVELLLSNGADPNIPDNEEFTSIHNAVTRVDILKLLLTKCSNVNARNNRGETPLCIAVEKNSNECAMTLLEHNADPNIGDNEGLYICLSVCLLYVCPLNDVLSCLIWCITVCLFVRLFHLAVTTHCRCHSTIPGNQRWEP